MHLVPELTIECMDINLHFSAFCYSIANSEVIRETLLLIVSDFWEKGGIRGPWKLAFS